LDGLPKKILGFGYGYKNFQVLGLGFGFGVKYFWDSGLDFGFGIKFFRFWFGFGYVYPTQYPNPISIFLGLECF